MKRFHVHLHVDDLNRSIGFYSQLFAAQPARGRTHAFAQIFERVRTGSQGCGTGRFRPIHEAKGIPEDRIARHGGHRPGATAKTAARTSHCTDKQADADRTAAAGGRAALASICGRTAAQQVS